MATTTKQSFYAVKFRRGGFTVRHAQNLRYKAALAAMRSLNNQGIAAFMEHQ